MENIFDRLKNGETILPDDPGRRLLDEEVSKSRRIVCEMNSSYRTDEELRMFLSEITGTDVDESVKIFLPFYVAYGKNTRFGKNVFINYNCTFLDLGGITLEDGVFIGPGTSVITESHPEEYELRHGLCAKPVTIRKNAWIGAGAIILPGVTIGENSIVGAGAVVTKDVPANSVAVGNPAKFLREVKK